MDFNSTMRVVQNICTAQSLQESYLLYRAYKSELRGWRFVFANERGSFSHLGMKQEFPNTAVIKNLFSCKQLSVLDEHTVEDMESKQPIPFDYSVSLDTQAVSYLYPYIFGSRKLSEGVTGDIVEVFDFLARPDVNCDPLPYLRENTRNIIQGNHSDDVYNTMYAFEILKTLDVNKYESSRSIVSLYSNHKNTKSVLSSLSSMSYALNSNFQLLDSIKSRYLKFLCVLLKIIEIGIRNKKSKENKAISLLEFMHNDMATLMHRELLIGCAFFESGVKFDFFDKIHKGNPKLFTYIHSMTWDIMHIQEREEAYDFVLRENTRYFFSNFLTFDRRLASLIDKFPIKAMALAPNSITYNFYEKGVIPFLNDYLGNKFSCVDRFFFEDAVMDRERRRSNCTNYYYSLAENIAESIASINNSEVPEGFFSII